MVSIQPPPSAPPATSRGVIELAFAGHCLRLHLQCDQTLNFFRDRYLPWPAVPGAGLIEAWELPGPAPGLLVGGREYRWSGTLDEWPLVLEMIWLQQVLRHPPGWLVLHGAALSRRGVGLCLVGDPGCGKTTLACTLAAQAEVRLLSDELACLNAEGCLQPFPRLPDLSPAARQLLAEAGLGYCTKVSPLPQAVAGPLRIVCLAAPPLPEGQRLAVSGEEAKVQAVAADSGLAVSPGDGHWWLYAPAGQEAKLAQAAQLCGEQGVFVLGAGHLEPALAVGPEPVLEKLDPLAGLFTVLPQVRNRLPGESAEGLLERVAGGLSRAQFYRLQLGPAGQNAAAIIELWSAT